MRTIVVAFATAVSVAIVVQAGQAGGAGQAGQPQAGQAGPAGQQGRRGFGRGNTPTFPGPPAGRQRADTALPQSSSTSR